MTSESDEKIALRNVIDSPSLDEANSGGGYEGRNGPLKKGPWTIAEDAILVEYVTKHGEGNWNAVQKHTELARCGKSCRLRWTNHLRPDLKKGAFTPEEERRVVELHAKMGNKWAQMVTELPGRTDNEIKNFWNTRIKRRQRAGLPIYPPDICPEPLNENQQNDINTLSPDFMQNNNFEIPALEFKNLELDQQQLYPPQLLNIPSSSLMPQNLNSSSYPNNSFLSTLHPSKRFKGSNCLFPGLNAAFGNFLPNGSQYQNAQPFIMLPSTYDSQNANISSSEKLELPSFQSQMGRWGSPSSPLTSMDSVNILTQTPRIEQSQSCDLSPRSSGLLEEVLYESKTMNNSNNTSYHDLYETEWGANGELVSLPLEFSGNSLDEHQPIGTSPGCKSKAAATSLVLTQSVDDAETPSQRILSRPDMLLGSNCFGPKDTTIKDHVMLKESIGTLLRDDLSQRDYKQTGTLSAQAHQNDSCPWNTLSSVYSLVPQFDEM